MLITVAPASSRLKIESMSWRLGTRRTRRRQRAAHGRFIDARATLRGALRHGGMPLELRRQKRKIKTRPLVVIITGIAFLVTVLFKADVTAQGGAYATGVLVLMSSGAFAVALVFGAVLIYCFWLVIATVAFWVVNMWHAVELFDGIFQTGRWPIGIYPTWLRVSVTFLVPIAFAVTVPAEALTSRLDWQTLVLAVVFTIVAFAFARWFWRFGLRRYSGASA